MLTGLCWSARAGSELVSSNPPVDTQCLASSPLGKPNAPLSRVLVHLCTPGHGSLGDSQSLHTSTYKVTAITVKSALHLKSLVESLSNNWHKKEPPGFKYSKRLNFWRRTWAGNGLLHTPTPPVRLQPSVFWVWCCGHLDWVDFCVSPFSGKF